MQRVVILSLSHAFSPLLAHLHSFVDTLSFSAYAKLILSPQNSCPRVVGEGKSQMAK